MLDLTMLTRDRLHPSRVIAKGRRIRDLSRLLREYGGTASQWTKRAGPIFDWEGKPHEIHWYEHHGIGSYEHKLVRKDQNP